MKVKTLVIFSLLNIFSFYIFSQCSSEGYSDRKWKPLMQPYTPIKNYRIDGKGGVRKKIEYTAVLSKDTFYRIAILSKDGLANGIVMRVYNSKHVVIASNENGKAQEQITTFEIKATGVYYIVFSFNDSKSYCGFSQIGFKRIK